MLIATIEKPTRIIGKSQGYYGLPIRDQVIDATPVRFYGMPVVDQKVIDPVTGKETPQMTTAWQPTLKELQALVDGATIHVSILGSAHPPIMLSVGPVPE